MSTEAAGASEGRSLPWLPARGAVLIQQEREGRNARRRPPILTCPCFSLLPHRKGLTCSMHWISWRTKPSWRSSSSALGMATYSITCTIGSAPAWGQRRYVHSGHAPHRAPRQLGPRRGWPGSGVGTCNRSRAWGLGSGISLGPGRVPSLWWPHEQGQCSPLSSRCEGGRRHRPLSHTEVGRLSASSHQASGLVQCGRALGLSQDTGQSHARGLPGRESLTQGAAALDPAWPFLHQLQRAAQGQGKPTLIGYLADELECGLVPSIPQGAADKGSDV